MTEWSSGVPRVMGALSLRLDGTVEEVRNRVF
jgi:hypothetical protein